MQDQRPILVFAQSARFIAESATQAGFPVWVADCYADTETLACAERYSKLPPFAELSQVQLLQRLTELSQQQACYLLCGTGIEHYYPFLSHLPSHIQLLGPSASTIALLKQPEQFYPLIQQLQLNMPKTTSIRPANNTAGWLVKSSEGYGGNHIKKLENCHDKIISESDYYQRHQKGITASACFMSNGKEVHLLSINQQEHDEQFHLHGILAPYQLAEDIESELLSAVTLLCQAVDLRGINSIDFIVDGNDLYILEINPRISASAELLNNPDLIAMHMGACHGDTLPQVQPTLESYRYLSYLFAQQDMSIPAQFPWPDCCHDIPHAKTSIRKSEPICTLLVSASSLKQCKAIAQHYKTFIQQKLSELS